MKEGRKEGKKRGEEETLNREGGGGVSKDEENGDPGDDLTSHGDV
jgi:hypothetical protein